VPPLEAIKRWFVVVSYVVDELVYEEDLSPARPSLRQSGYAPRDSCAEWQGREGAHGEELPARRIGCGRPHRGGDVHAAGHSKAERDQPTALLASRPRAHRSIGNHPINRIDELLPWAVAAKRLAGEGLVLLSTSGSAGLLNPLGGRRQRRLGALSILSPSSGSLSCRAFGRLARR
jgi:hypothetical protein